jgi:RNA polymerase sigma factor (sigma-70 family)
LARAALKGSRMTTEDFPVDVAELALLGEKFEEHRPKLLAMLNNRMDPALRVRLDPDDILAESFLRTKDRWQDFVQSGLPVYVWLRRVVMDCLKDKWDFHTAKGRTVRGQVQFPDGSSSQVGMGLISPLTSPSAALARKEEQERTRLVLEGLQHEDQEILCLRHFDQLSLKDAAVELGIADGTARQRYARARLRFRELWKKLYGEEGLSHE